MGCRGKLLDHSLVSSRFGTNWQSLTKKSVTSPEENILRSRSPGTRLRYRFTTSWNGLGRHSPHPHNRMDLPRLGSRRRLKRSRSQTPVLAKKRTLTLTTASSPLRRLPRMLSHSSGRKAETVTSRHSMRFDYLFLSQIANTDAD